MPRISRQEPKPDVLEVVHHEIPQDAAAAGAPAIPQQGAAAGEPAPIAPVPLATTSAAEATATAASPAYAEGGMTWRTMAGTLAIAEAAGLLTLLVAGSIYGLEFFFPLAVAGVLYVVAAVWIRRATKASTVYTLTINALCLVMFGGMFFGWTGFLYPTSWFEMAFATLTVLLPIGGIVATVAALRHKNGTDAAKTPMRAVAAVASAVVLVGIVGSATAGDATRLPGDVGLAASNFEFEQTALSAKAGDVAIYFDNEDPFVHNVEIEGYGTSANAAGGKAIRHVFKGLKAGTYTYICAIHPDMKGTLTVT